MKIIIEDGDKVTEYQNVESYFLFGFFKDENKDIYDFESWSGKNKYLYQSLLYYGKLIETDLFGETKQIDIDLKTVLKESLKEDLAGLQGLDY